MVKIFEDCGFDTLMPGRQSFLLCISSMVLGLVLPKNFTYEIAICGKNGTAGLPGTLIVRRLWPIQMFPQTDFFAKKSASRLEIQESPQKTPIKSRFPDLEYVQVEKSIMRVIIGVSACD